MAEEAMKKLRDEVAMRVLGTMLETYVANPSGPVFEMTAMCEQAFRLAETFLAVRYDFDMGKRKIDQVPPLRAP